MDIKEKETKAYARLEEMILESYKNPIIVASTVSVTDFPRYYVSKKDGILRLRGDITHTKVPGSFEVSFATRGWDSEDGIIGYIPFPDTVAQELGLEILPENEVTLFLEPTKDEFRAYLAKPNTRLLSRKKICEIEREVDEFLREIGGLS